MGADDWYPERQGFDENYGGCDYGQPPSYYDPFSNKRLKGINGLPGKKKGQYLTDRECDEALGFISRKMELLLLQEEKIASFEFGRPVIVNYI